jgi:NAD(P)-dependent dehydrogenase (short-subunit alcohol dehydrogenase family)
MVDRAMARFGRLDCAFNNAGVGGVHKHIADVSIADWRRILSINLDGVFHCIKAELGAMRQSGGGAIVNTASVAGLVAAPTLAEYTAAKHGVIGLTKAAALDLIGENIRVNAICPGATDTPMLAAALADPAIARRFGDTTPIGRVASVREMVGTVLFLCSEEASYIVGQAIAVDGGTVIQ